MAACRLCHAELPAEARFCPACGARAHQAERVGEERKVVTVLFADLVGSTAAADRRDPEDVRAVLLPFYDRMRVELEARGGRVEKFIGDAVMALFGAPVAREDDPERGVRAALAIRDAIAGLNEERGPALSVRISVVTGEAVIDLHARPEEGEAMAAGDITNTGFRIAEAAPIDGILVDEFTYRATQHAMTFRRADQVTAKGKRTPIPVWEAIAPRARFADDDVLRPRGPLVGRRGELDQLLEVLDRARDGQSAQLVSVVGVPGIGKSRLVLELASVLDGRPEIVTWRQGRSVAHGDRTPFWALAQIVKAGAGILRTDDPLETEAKLRQAIGHALPDAAEAAWAETNMRALVGLTAGGHGRDEEFAAWRRYLEGLAARRPLVLVFEDVHWADEGLLEFIDHLVAWTTGVPLLVICTARPSLFERHPGWGRQGSSTILALEPLSDEETSALVASVLGAVIPGEVERDVLARAEGNPLYAQEYARMLVDRGFLRRADDGWQLERPDELPLPETVQGIIAARLDTLPPEEKALLHSAAVVGRVFWVGALARLGGLPHYVVGERLASLERKSFLRRETTSPIAGETQYAFHHVLVRDIAYGQIPRAGRADKHRLAAEWLEGLRSDRADLAEPVAHHYQRALAFARAAGQDVTDLTERARFALRDAGDRAAALQAWTEARRLYAEALELWPEDADRAALGFSHGKASFRADGGGAEILATVLPELVVQGRLELAAEAEVVLGELAFRHGDRAGAFARFDAALALLSEAPASATKAHVLSTLSRYHSVALEAEDAVRIGRQALEMADTLGLDEVRAHALNNIGSARIALGDRGGIADLERSLEIALARTSPECVRTYLNLGTSLAHFGDLRRTFSVHAEGRRAAERFGDGTGVRWFATERLWELYWCGGWDEALAHADSFLAEDAPGWVEESASRLVHGWIGLARGRLDEAVESLTTLCAFVRDARYPQMTYPALALRARALAAAGRDEEAWADAAELVRIWGENGAGVSTYWTADLAFAASELGRGADLLEPLAASPSTLWIQAAGATASGDFGQAARLYAEIGSLPDAALARLRAAQALLGQGRRDEARAHLDHALGFYRSVAAERYLREGEELLAVVA
jgi:class 3 adenylate cyclase/tetratricopeptide (TPR) repeat protein